MRSESSVDRRGAGAGREDIIGRLQELALESLRGAGSEGPFALVDFPDHANVGDSAIWLGTTAFFRHHRGTQPAYVASARSFSERELRAAVPDGPIFIHGGGNFGDLWPRHHEFREHLLERFADREIVQLPQSIHFEDSGRARRTARAIARHGKFRLLVRDRPSYGFAAARFDCEVALCPDMALFIGALSREPPEVDLVCLLRTDRERLLPERAGGPAGHTPPGVDWLVENRFWMEVEHLRCLLREIRSGRWRPLVLRAARYQVAALTRLRRGCRLLSSGRVVITDRLHAHILCLLLGIPHAVLDNSYGKLGRFLDAWTGGTMGVHRASSTEEARRWAAGSAAMPDGRRACSPGR
jgi:pyruvyl transferase EpsO